ncbi:MAG: dehydrogenase, partial [Actinomycetota bacterium]|nr:dehydrogenase [Actinomycetota bacterium]
SATIAFDDPHLRSRRWSSFPAYARSKLAVMLWGLELDRRLRAAGSPVTSQLTHPGWVASNLSNVSDTRVMSALHAAAQSLAKAIGNDIDAGAAPSLYCISEPIPPGSYVGIDGRFGFKGGPTLSGRAPIACDYDAARRLWEFAETETGTTLPV